jgi:hypothetical protein
VGAERLRRIAAAELLEQLRSPRKEEEGFGPARVVLATDGGLPGDRAALTAHLDAPRRYKANREAVRRARARDFWPIVEQLDTLVEALRIRTPPPADFQAQTWEADDGAATALLRAWPGIDKLLAEVPPFADAIAAMAAGLVKTTRERDKVKRAWGDASGLIADADREADELALWTVLALVHEHRADVELSAKLVTLRTDCPIIFDLDDALVGGWEVREVRRVLDWLGCRWLGREVEPRPKPAPEVTEGKGSVTPALFGASRSIVALRRRPGAMTARILRAVKQSCFEFTSSGVRQWQSQWQTGGILKPGRGSAVAFATGSCHPAAQAQALRHAGPDPRPERLPRDVRERREGESERSLRSSDGQRSAPRTAPCEINPHNRHQQFC